MTDHETPTPHPAIEQTAARSEFPRWLRGGLITAGVAYAAAFVTAFLQVLIAVTTSGLPDAARYLFPGAAQLVPLAHLGGLGADGAVPLLGTAGASLHVPSLLLVFVEAAVVIVLNWRARLTIRERLLSAAVAAVGFVLVMVVLAASLPLAVGSDLLTADLRALDAVSALVAVAVVFAAAMLRGLPVRARTFLAPIRVAGMPLVTGWVLAALVVVIAFPVALHATSAGSLTPLMFPAVATASLAVFAGGVADLGGALGSLTSVLPGSGAERFSVSVWNGQLPVLWIGVVVFALLVVVAGVLSALRQRGRRSEVDSVLLVAVFGLAGLAVQLFGTITVDANSAGLSGHGSFGPAAWTFLVFLIWGGVAEVVARFVALRLIAAAPVFSARLASVAGADGFTAPEERKPLSRRVVVTAVAVAGALVLVAGVSVAAGVVRSVVFGPDRATAAYFAALERGDAETAVSMLGSKDAGKGLLSNEVYSHATDRPGDAHVTKVVQTDSQATVEVTYRQGNANRTADVQLRRTGTDWLIADKWFIVGGVGTGSIHLSGVSGIQGIAISSGGREVGTISADGFSLGALPGTYTFAAAKNPYIDVAQQTVTVDPETVGGNADATFTGTPTKALDVAANKAIAGYLQKCASSTDASPADCPIEIPSYWSAANISYKLGEIPHATVDLQDDGTLTAVSDDDLTYSYAYDQTFFGTTHISDSTHTGFRADLTVGGDGVTVSRIDQDYGY